MKAGWEKLVTVDMLTDDKGMLTFDNWKWLDRHLSIDSWQWKITFEMTAEI